MRHPLRLTVIGLLAGAAIAATIGAASSASANDALTEGKAALQDFARASQPQWNFPFALKNAPCWPEDAFKNGKPNPGRNPAAWPDSDSGCIYKGAEQSLAFPTYYTAQKCGANEIRVSYTLYMARSGFAITGHKHDFEHIDVVWTRVGNAWHRDRLLLSQHAGHQTVAWNNVNSYDTARTTEGKGREHPRVYVGWGSHAMFNEPGGGKDAASQLTSNEFRTSDYRSWADRGGQLIDVAVNGPLFQKFEASEPAAWDGTSSPANNAKKACGH